MKAGDTVTVYEDPITELRPEGDVRLLKLQTASMGNFEGRVLQYWSVEFLDGDSLQTERSILTPKN
jgi:hypothetical protein